MSKVVFTPSTYNNNHRYTLNRGERMTAFETARAFKKHWLRWLNIAPKHLESNENNEMQQCLHFATLKQQYNHSQEIDTFNSLPMTNNDLAHQDALDRDTVDQQQNRPGLATSSLPNHLTERTPKVNFVKSNFSISKVNFSSSTEPLYSEKKLATGSDPAPVAALGVPSCRFGTPSECQAAIGHACVSTVVTIVLSALPGHGRNHSFYATTWSALGKTYESISKCRKD